MGSTSSIPPSWFRGGESPLSSKGRFESRWFHQFGHSRELMHLNGVPTYPYVVYGTERNRSGLLVVVH